MAHPEVDNCRAIEFFAMEDKLSRAESEIEELKRRRKEDAQANEKVVSIFAAREQSWMAERQSLRRQIEALLGELCGLKSSDTEYAANLKTLSESLEEESKRRKVLEEKAEFGEQMAEEMRERLKTVTQEHAAELWKHKATLVELLSNQCRMESEMGRALVQVEAAKGKLEMAVREKDAAAEAEAKLSEECAMIRKDCEQKDKILGAVLRKSKLDATEKQVLLNEVKLLRAKKTQAEAEMRRWRKMWESSKRRNGNPKHLLPEYLEAEGKRELDDLQELQDWVRTGNEKHASIIKQRHHAEVEAFIEQMRQKEETLETYQRQVLGKALEIKMLQSHIEGLDRSLSHLREENVKLEVLLLKKEKETELLKEQLSFLFHRHQKSNSSCSLNPGVCQQKPLCSEVKLKERKTGEKYKDSKPKSTGKFTEIKVGNTRLRQMGSNEESEIYKEKEEIGTNHFQEHEKHCREDMSPEPERAEISLQEQAEAASVTLHSPKEEIKEVKEVRINPHTSNEQNGLQEDAAISGKFTSPEPSFIREAYCWKTYVHTFGVSYNIKRLKQQQLVLEKLAGLLTNKQLANMDTINTGGIGAEDRKIDEDKQNMKGFFLMKSLLHKQVKRYQSLEEKTDDLCNRMEDNYQLGSRRDSQGVRTKEQSETLMCYLEETFELQKCVVATGQKFTEMQSKTNSIFSGADAHDKSIGFNLRQFADIIRTIFEQVQKGLELRIARMIGQLEGKLACDSILHR
ncbi:myosin heavy chain, skeletal muscle-like isoform X2 [Zingiber officinale]|uniref:myosin heavy chain, skeletal muscle-like isoform X2 n=1 Tax=Zingiber officinale TaxID=94328 RepID=UPI001C4BD153|nr:myosin heavy chain, skeletal muscle-like isoform X2 [Zingiber officinale]